MLRPSRPAPLLDANTIVPGEPLIEFRDVSIGFDEGDVLRGLSFDVSPGETKVFLGESGSGKTLIMKLAAGLLQADAGHIWVMGHNIGEMSENELLDFRRHLGFVFQEGALFDSMTVAENVAFRLREENVPDAEVDERVREALKFVELEAALDKYPAELSGGMRRRVAIARAIITQPEVLLYDSPTGGLDPVTSNTIIELIMKQRDVYKTSALLVTHRLQDAFTMATHQFDKASNQMVALPKGQHCDVPMSFLILRDGKVIFDGDAHQLATSRDDYIREYIS